MLFGKDLDKYIFNRIAYGHKCLGLPVVTELKLTTMGLVDVKTQKLVPLFV